MDVISLLSFLNGSSSRNHDSGGSFCLFVNFLCCFSSFDEGIYLAYGIFFSLYVITTNNFIPVDFSQQW
jgi:hypothetical protein